MSWDGYLNFSSRQPVPGVSEITSVQKKVGDVACPESSTPAPAAPQVVMGSSTKVLCRCPEDRTFASCFTTVNSTGNTHTLTCNDMTSTTIACGSDLYGRDVSSLLALTKYNHPLCSVRAYLSIEQTIEWSCQDPSVPVPATSFCPGDVTEEATTIAAASTLASKAATSTTGATTVAATSTARGTTGEATTAATTAAATSAAATTAAATTAAATTAAATTAAASTAAEP